jgi:AAA+ ATPase superfamily predicted ATPase
MIGMEGGTSFVDRTMELAALGDAYSRKSSLVVIYGRRRLGKTSLVKRFMEGRRGVYFLFTKEPEHDQLYRLARAVGKAIGSRRLEDFGASSFEDLFAEIGESCKSEKLVLALDEFPYLASQDPTIPSIFQKIWDEYLKGSNVMLVLTGSSVGMMRSEVLSYSAPLYGRATAILHLKQMGFKDVSALMPAGMGFEDRLMLYFMFGGVPAYYAALYQGGKAKSYTIERAMEAVLAEGAIFAEEPSVMLSEEVTNDARYLIILSLLAEGVNKPSEIASRLNIAQSNLQKYLTVLEGIGVVEREFPVTEARKSRSKRGIYAISDNFTFFYFYVLRKITADLRAQPAQAAIEAINLLGRAAPKRFELLVREVVWSLSGSGSLPFTAFSVGRWWGRNHSKPKGKDEEEIDIMALNPETRDMLVGEAEWRNRKMDISDYMSLKEKAKAVEWNDGDRSVYYALFSKAGFTEGMEKMAKEEGVMLFDLDAIERALAGKSTA